MATKTKVCKADELQAGQSKCVTIHDKEIGVFNIGGKLYAIDNLCIHAGGPLHEGAVDPENCQVTCTWHGWAFDLATGKCVTHPRQDVFAGTYTVTVEGDEVFVEV